MKLFVCFLVFGLAGAYPDSNMTNILSDSVASTGVACGICKSSVGQIQELFTDENVVSVNQVFFIVFKSK